MSGVLDVTIIKPLIESVIGVDLITHDDLNGLERGMKGVSALLSIYATGTVLLGTNVSKIGTQEVLAYTAKTMVVDSSAQLTALGVQKIGERCDLPVAITIILSFISGIVVSTKVDGIKIQRVRLGYVCHTDDGVVTFDGSLVAKPEGIISGCDGHLLAVGMLIIQTSSKVKIPGF